MHVTRNYCKIQAQRAITAWSWDHLVYLCDLAMHKDHLPHHKMMSQSVLLLWRHLPNIENIIKCLHDDISGPCVNLLILAPELGGTVPLIGWVFIGSARDSEFNSLFRKFLRYALVSNTSALWPTAMVTILHGNSIECHKCNISSVMSNTHFPTVFR